MELQVGVKAFLRNEEGKFLLLRRSSEKYPHVGNEVWDIAGGRINPGQTLLENLRREIKEEVSLNLTKEPRLIAAQDILKVPGKHVVRLTYIGDIDGIPNLDEDHEEFKWVSVNEMLSMEGMDRFAKEILEKHAHEFGD